jgi:hypothetical protein
LRAKRPWGKPRNAGRASKAGYSHVSNPVDRGKPGTADSRDFTRFKRTAGGYNNVINHFTREFINDFCEENGSTYWETLVSFSSGGK